MSYLPPRDALLATSAVEHGVHGATGDRDQLVRTTNTARARQKGRRRRVDRTQQHADRYVPGIRHVALIELTIPRHVELRQRERGTGGEIEDHQPGAPPAAARVRTGLV